MKSKLIYIAISGTILMVLVRIFVKRWRCEQKKTDEKLDRQMEQTAKEMMDEAIRHNKAMKDIEEEGERYRAEAQEKLKQDILEIYEKFENMMPTSPLEFTIKYQDQNGDIHTINANDREEFRKVMRNKSNKLIFN